MSTNTKSSQSESSSAIENKHPSEVNTRGEAILYMQKNGMEDLLDVSNLCGVGDKLEERLTNRGFATITDIHHENPETLMWVPGIDEELAEGIKAHANRKTGQYWSDNGYCEYPYTPFMDHEPAEYF